MRQHLHVIARIVMVKNNEATLPLSGDVSFCLNRTAGDTVIAGCVFKSRINYAAAQRDWKHFNACIKAEIERPPRVEHNAYALVTGENFCQQMGMLEHAMAFYLQFGRSTG